jgi:hypothetical protein
MVDLCELEVGPSIEVLRSYGKQRNHFVPITNGFVEWLQLLVLGYCPLSNDKHWLPDPLTGMTVG